MEEEEENLGEAEEPPSEEAGKSAEAQPLSREQKEMVKRLHVNMGHLPVDRLLVMLKAANAQQKVLRYVREEMHCEECMRQRRELRRKKATYPRMFEFNRIVGVDIFYIKWGGKKMPFLNVVDHGSNCKQLVWFDLQAVECPQVEPPQLQTHGDAFNHCGFGPMEIRRY